MGRRGFLAQADTDRCRIFLRLEDPIRSGRTRITNVSACAATGLVSKDASAPADAFHSGVSIQAMTTRTRSSPVTGTVSVRSGIATPGRPLASRQLPWASRRWLVPSGLARSSAATPGPRRRTGRLDLHSWCPR